MQIFKVGLLKWFAIYFGTLASSKDLCKVSKEQFMHSDTAQSFYALSCCQ